MTITPAALVGGVTLGTSSAVIYTVPASTKAVIKSAVFVNTDTASDTLTVAITRSGGSAVTVIKAVAIAPGTPYLAREMGNLVLNAGDTVSAYASAASVINTFVSGFVVQ